MNRATLAVSTISALLLLAACAAGQSETYGFIATLGDDTTSVERVVRTGDRIVSDAVGRSPTVVRRHWEATLGPDGRIRRWTMDTTIPNAPAGERELHHEAVFTDSTVELTRRTGSGSRRFTYPRTYAVTVPWNAFVYGTYEVLFDEARELPDTTRIGQYFFEGWDEGNVGFARVATLGDGRYSIRSTGLAGSGVGTLDADGRLLSYTGLGTTYKQEVVRVADVPDLDAIAARFAADESAKGVARALSERDTARATLAGTTLSVEYSRPHARGRTLVGGLIPYDQVWRTGANAATHLTTSGPVRLGGVDLDAGAYTLWTLPTRDGVQLVINSQTGQWGTRYRSTADIARVPMQVDTLSSPVERFTIRIEPDLLAMEWGTFRWTAPLVAQ